MIVAVRCDMNMFAMIMKDGSMVEIPEYNGWYVYDYYSQEDVQTIIGDEYVNVEFTKAKIPGYEDVKSFKMTVKCLHSQYYVLVLSSY